MRKKGGGKGQPREVVKKGSKVKQHGQCLKKGRSVIK
jgi:hypothetical protein